MWLQHLDCSLIQIISVLTSKNVSLIRLFSLCNDQIIKIKSCISGLASQSLFWAYVCISLCIIMLSLFLVYDVQLYISYVQALSPVSQLVTPNPLHKMLCLFCRGMSHWGLFLWAQETSCGGEETLAVGQGQKDKTWSISSSDKGVIISSSRHKQQGRHNLSY